MLSRALIYEAIAGLDIFAQYGYLGLCLCLKWPLNETLFGLQQPQKDSTCLVIVFPFLPFFWLALAPQ